MLVLREMMRDTLNVRTCPSDLKKPLAVKETNRRKANKHDTLNAVKGAYLPYPRNALL